MTRKSCAAEMRNAIKVPDVGFVGVLDRPLSIYHYSNITLKLSGQNCNFLSFFGLSKKTTPNIEVCPESLGAMLEFDISNVAYSLDLKLCTYMFLLTLTQSILKKRKEAKRRQLRYIFKPLLSIHSHTFSWSGVFFIVLRYFCYRRFLHYCFSLFLLLYLGFINLVQSQLTCYLLLSLLRKISLWPFILILFNLGFLLKRPHGKQRFRC